MEDWKQDFITYFKNITKTGLACSETNHGHRS